MQIACAASFLTTPAWAWNPFARTKIFQEVELSPAEWQKVELRAGWAADSDNNLLIEIGNRLPGPLACHGALVTLQSGDIIRRAFTPYLYIPPAATKQAGVNGVKKRPHESLRLDLQLLEKRRRDGLR
ncbi:MAG: hypothetical protein EBQ71_13095 [Betaproteobacteria bacterium]|nr:hypothetical protein [Betaproteobacteria bacterium]